MSFESVKKAWEREMEKGMEAPVRIVSPQQYAVLEVLAERGLLAFGGHPIGQEGVDLYFELMAKPWPWKEHV